MVAAERRLATRETADWRPAPVAEPIARSRAAGSLAADGAVVLALLAACNLAVSWHGLLAGRLFVLAFVLLVPGALVCSLTGLRPREVSVRIAWCLGASMLVAMLLGLAGSLVLPHLGVARPLRAVPLLAGLDVVVLALLAAAALARRAPLEFVFQGRFPSAGEVRDAAVAALLPIAAAAGAERLDNGHGAAVSLAVLAAVGAALVGLFVLAEHLPARSFGLVLYGATAAALLLSSMRTAHPFGFDIQTEYQVFASTLHHGAWHVPPSGNAYAAMLSITVLPSVLSASSGVSPVELFKLLYPLVFAIFPVLVFVTASRRFSRRAALVGAIVVVVQGLFAADMTGLARQEIGLVYFGLFVVTAFDRSLPRHWRQLGAAVAVAGMAISHYSTAYFAAIVLLGGFLAYRLARLLWRSPREPAVLTTPLVAASLGLVVVWNVVVTRSTKNVANVVHSLSASGLGLLPGGSGSSLLQRFLTADVSPSVSAGRFATLATRSFHQHAPWLHPYPTRITARYPVTAAHVPGSGAGSGGLGIAMGDAATAAAEALLVVTVLGVLVWAWRSRRAPWRGELAASALACLVLVGLLRVSGTLASLYNAPRALVQAAPLLSLGIAAACSWLFARQRLVRTVALGATVAGLCLLFVSNVGLADLAFGGAPDLLANSGEGYQRYDITDADVASAGWVVRHQAIGQIVYADIYASLQIYEHAHPAGLVQTVIPTVLEPGALVYASSTNVVEGTARSQVGGGFAVYRFPSAFLHRVKDVVFTTGTTEVYR